MHSHAFTSESDSESEAKSEAESESEERYHFDDLFEEPVATKVKEILIHCIHQRGLVFTQIPCSFINVFDLQCLWNYMLLRGDMMIVVLIFAHFLKYQIMVFSCLFCNTKIQSLVAKKHRL